MLLFLAIESANCNVYFMSQNHPVILSPYKTFQCSVKNTSQIATTVLALLRQGSWLSPLPHDRTWQRLKSQVRDSSVPESNPSWLQPSSWRNQLQAWDCHPAFGILINQRPTIWIPNNTRQATKKFIVCSDVPHTHTRLERINRVIRRELNPIHAKPEKTVA